MGLKILAWLLLSSISKDDRKNTTTTNMKSLKQSMEEVAIDVELELELSENK